MELPLPCIVCGFQPEAESPVEGINQPYAATAFTSHGHYGSTAFDPMNGTFIEINVCDPCLRSRAGRVGEGQDRRRVMHPSDDGLVIGMEDIPWREQPPLKPWDPS